MEVANDNNAENDADTSQPQPLGSQDGSEDGAIEEPAKKDGNGITLADPVLLQHAKKRLSKWAARLFDPDRPRGLVQAPQTIPLNDEFLTAFGKREKEYDEQMGKSIKLDSTIASDDENDDDDDEETQRQKQAAKQKKDKEKAAKKKGKSLTKIKLTNLAYRTTSANVTAACEQFGPLAEVKLILDADKDPTPTHQNSGRGYVTFENAQDAEACIEGLKTLDGRAVRITMANAKPQGATGKGNASSSSSGAPRPASALNRSLEKDISTICYRCGGVGHIGANCTNAAKPKPCELCGSTEHPNYHCPCKQICFNCGTPGHVNRACPYQRGLPRRICCSICLYPGHHRLQCRANEHYVYHPGVMDIMKGSKTLKWFHGLRGITCSNCGSQGHFGWECTRPQIHHLVQDNELTTREIERATAESMAEQIEQQRSRNTSRGRDNTRGGGGGKKNRYREVQSLPPKRSISGSSRNSSNGSNNNNNGRGYGTNGGGGKNNKGNNGKNQNNNKKNNKRGYDTGSNPGGGSRKRSRGY